MMPKDSRIARRAVLPSQLNRATGSIQLQAKGAARQISGAKPRQGRAQQCALLRILPPALLRNGRQQRGIATASVRKFLGKPAPEARPADSLENRSSRGNSACNSSITCLISKWANDTRRKLSWQLEIVKKIAVSARAACTRATSSSISCDNSGGMDGANSSTSATSTKISGSPGSAEWKAKQRRSSARRRRRSAQPSISCTASYAISFSSTAAGHCQSIRSSSRKPRLNYDAIGCLRSASSGSNSGSSCRCAVISLRIAISVPVPAGAMFIRRNNSWRGGSAA
jgi:hypothetical protein